MWTDLLRSELSLFAVDLLTGQLALAQSKMYERRLDTKAIGAMTNSANAISVETTAGMCGCGFVTQYGLLCRHILATMDADLHQTGMHDKDERRGVLAQQCLKHAHPRWHHTSLFRALELTCAPQQEQTQLSRRNIANTQSSNMLIAKGNRHRTALRIRQRS